jgi:hypothetical protein
VIFRGMFRRFIDTGFLLNELIVLVTPGGHGLLRGRRRHGDLRADLTCPSKRVGLSKCVRRATLALFTGLGAVAVWGLAKLCESFSSLRPLDYDLWQVE